MKKSSFPFVALGIGLVLMAALLAGGSPGDASQRALPLLTLLIISEFGMFLTGISAWMGIGTMRESGFTPLMLFLVAACAALAVAFLVLGIDYWPL